MIALRTSVLIGALGALVGATMALAPAAPSSAQSLANPKSELVDNLGPQAWLSVTDKTERGHRNGNPDAEAKLIEFISYTCSHCADFARQGDGTLDVAAVGPGFISVEVRPVIRNYLDLVVTMLAQCGDPAGFKERHRALLYSQGQWLPKAVKAPRSQQEIWARGTPDARVNAASALGLDDTMRDRGFSTPQITNCLRDETVAQKILANDKADRAQFNITGTPTFALNGQTLTEAHDWPSLAGILQERFRPGAQAQGIENGRVYTAKPQ